MQLIFNNYTSSLQMSDEPEIRLLRQHKHQCPGTLHSNVRVPGLFHACSRAFRAMLTGCLAHAVGPADGVSRRGTETVVGIVD